MKKTFCLIMALVLLTGVLFGCSAKKTESQTTGSDAKQENASGGNDAQGSMPAQSAQMQTFGDEEIAYVMIYNPQEYSENQPNKASTGSIGSQISISGVRADELEEFRPKYYTNTQVGYKELFGNKEVDYEGIRAGELIPIYLLGDAHSFYYGMTYTALGRFDCVYVGESCYVWVLNDAITKETAEKIGTEFDQVIYAEDVKMFGTPRYADEGGKISILCYPMHSEGLGGFFYANELFQSGEYFTDAEAEYYGINLNHAIIHINTDEVGASITPEVERNLLGVAAHEFQHLINFTDLFCTVQNGMDGSYPDTWLNEAMSCYASEAIYPRFEEENYSHCYALFLSDLVGHGQSLYNFTDTDIGAYGASYLFAAYLANLAGGDVFNRIHTYWRTDLNSPLSEAAAITRAMPEEYAADISERYAYPGDVQFSSPEAEQLSKIVLDYYVTLLSKPEEMSESMQCLFEEAAYYGGLSKAETLNLLLYDEINPASIEGGGRIIVATKDGTFTIPEDADPNLVYIGFDKDFQPVTGVIHK